jgi:hypothetical protein
MELRYATSQIVPFRMIIRGSTDFAGASDWTPVAGDVKIAIDGGTQANTTNLPTAVGKAWYLTLTTGETTGGILMIDIIDQGTKAVEDQGLDFFTFGNASAYIARDLYSSNPAGIKKNTALTNYKFRMSDIATGEPKAGLTVAVQQCIDSASSFTTCTNSPATEVANGVYRISFTAAEMNGDDIAIRYNGGGTAKELTEKFITEP